MASLAPLADDRLAGWDDKAMGADLIVVGALGALAAVAALILMWSSGPTRIHLARPSPRRGGHFTGAAPADQDHSWLCGLLSDDSAAGRRAAAAQLLAARGITLQPVTIPRQPASSAIVMG